MQLDIDQLSTLVAFADSGSVKGAAALVHKTPSAVSVQLAKLGSTIGRELLQKQGRRLLLTHDGTELVRHARRMLGVQREALAYFQAPEIGGSVRVGLPDDYIPVLMTPLLAHLSRIAPSAHVEVVCAPSAELRPLLKEGQLDIAILSAETDTQEGPVLRTERVVWITSSTHEAHKQEPVSIALFPDGCIFRRWALMQLTKRRREHRIACTSRSISAIQAAVISGFAVSVVAESCVTQGMRCKRMGVPP
ncbi:UNVERIFIED_ORG: DNA-binding transcriptional LysR family regulator [Variovorax paradoxus]|nr:DNA-binding transcriptional LysR family regulator [Variovorax paradoxus]